ncbi:MAG TPA: ATPase domain-containing protein, partial [Nitrosomonas sp.]|nr:ATPase domain-containing protein [Nitrosomonas sp.]
MAKQKSVYACTECGGQTLKWQGQCPHCQSWNTLIETVAEKQISRFSPVSETGLVQNLSEVEAQEETRYATGISELDRVLGGGLVRGGVVLLGGDPGIGKSTLLLQALSHMSGFQKVLYISGEESAQQVALRAKRLTLSVQAVPLFAEIQLEKIQAALSEHKPCVAVIDSIQTIY